MFEILKGQSKHSDTPGVTGVNEKGMELFTITKSQMTTNQVSQLCDTCKEEIKRETKEEIKEQAAGKKKGETVKHTQEKVTPGEFYLTLKLFHKDNPESITMCMPCGYTFAKGFNIAVAQLDCEK